MTNMVIRDPFMGIRQMMDRFFEEPVSTFPEFLDEGMLPIDISERDNALVVRASLPGVKKDDIDIQVTQGILSITARRSEEEEHRDERFYRRERRYGSVSRRVALPGVVQDADVEAELKDGVLTLTLPVPEQRRPKRIEIKGADEEGHMIEGQASMPGEPSMTDEQDAPATAAPSSDPQQAL